MHGTVIGTAGHPRFDRRTIGCVEALPIRPATVDDMHAMVDLSRHPGYPTAEPELRMRLEPILASAIDGVLLAIRDTRPIAWVHVAIEPTLEATDVAVL